MMTVKMAMMMAILRVRQSGNCDFQDIDSREINKLIFFSGGKGMVQEKDQSNLEHFFLPQFDTVSSEFRSHNFLLIRS